MITNLLLTYQHNGNYSVILSKYLYAHNKVFSLDNLVILQKEAGLKWVKKEMERKKHEKPRGHKKA